MFAALYTDGTSRFQHLVLPRVLERARYYVRILSMGAVLSLRAANLCGLTGWVRSRLEVFLPDTLVTSQLHRKKRSPIKKRAVCL